MILDLVKDNPSLATRTDVCIVGAGAAGIVLALELVRLGKSVTLLEGGGEEIEAASQETYQSELAGLPHAGIHQGRFRAKGGTTTRWGGQILELDELDFAERDWVAGSGWPFAKSELKSAYARALELEGLGAAMLEDESVWKRLGLQTPEIEELEPYFSRWCPEPNFALLHHKALEDASGPAVWLHANAVELMLEGERAIGVRCRTLTGVEAIFQASEYVFCLGAIESSRFFLQPRDAGLPWNCSGLLGRHFQDHIDSNGAVIRPRDHVRFHALFDNVFSGGLKYHPKLRLAASTQREFRTLNVAATMFFSSDLDEDFARMKEVAKHLLRGRTRELKTADLARVAANLPLLARQSYRYAVQHRAYNPPGSKIMLRVHCEQEPLSASSISLSETRDALGLFRTRLDWQISQMELDTIRNYIQVAQRSLQTIAEIVPDAELMAGGRGYIARCDDSNHHMGGMRMSSTAQNGVVDTNLRLYGTSNTYICSNAVFPSSGYSNPTHTLLALAVRLAEHLS